MYLLLDGVSPSHFLLSIFVYFLLILYCPALPSSSSYVSMIIIDTNGSIFYASHDYRRYQRFNILCIHVTDKKNFLIIMVVIIIKFIIHKFCFGKPFMQICGA